MPLRSNTLVDSVGFWMVKLAGLGNPTLKAADKNESTNNPPTPIPTNNLGVFSIPRRWAKADHVLRCRRK
ncbi:TPA: hypothetical protein DIV45_00325 [Patescibacteria group bacterium]|nr:hypothetical protein [Patescibacteria group bacterium]